MCRPWGFQAASQRAHGAVQHVQRQLGARPGAQTRRAARAQQRQPRARVGTLIGGTLIGTLIVSPAAPPGALELGQSARRAPLRRRQPPAAPEFGTKGLEDSSAHVRNVPARGGASCLSRMGLHSCQTVSQTPQAKS